MKDDLISFETAVLAKEKGFPVILTSKGSSNVKPTGVYSKISQSLLQKWLREVHNVILIVLLDRGKYDTPFYPWDDIQQDEVFFNFIIHDKEGKAHIFDGNYNTYEEALEQGLLEGLKLIK